MTTLFRGQMKAIEDNNYKNTAVLYHFFPRNLHFVEYFSIFAPVFI